MLAWLVILPWTRFFIFPSHVVFSHIPATRQECLVNFNCIPKKWTNIDYIVIFVGDPSMLTMRLYQFYPFFFHSKCGWRAWPIARLPKVEANDRRPRRPLSGWWALSKSQQDTNPQNHRGRSQNPLHYFVNSSVYAMPLCFPYYPPFSPILTSPVFFPLFFPCFSDFLLCSWFSLMFSIVFSNPFFLICPSQFLPKVPHRFLPYFRPDFFPYVFPFFSLRSILSPMTFRQDWGMSIQQHSSYFAVNRKGTKARWQLI